MGLPPNLQLKVPFGTLPNGKQVTPREVKTEFGWELKCSECKEPINLRCQESELIQPHFYHIREKGIREDKYPACHGGETALHNACKTWLANKKIQIKLPCEKTWIRNKIREKGKGSITPILGKFPNYTPDTLEIRKGENEVIRGMNTPNQLKADLIAQTDFGELAIEIRVTHKKTLKDTEKFRNLNLRCLEIDMREIFQKLENLTSFKEIEEALTESAERAWIHSPNQNLMILTDELLYHKFRKIQERRTKKTDIPRTIERSAPEKTITQTMTNETGREIVIVQSFSETRIYEPDDGRQIFQNSSKYEDAPQDKVVKTWSPVFKKEITRELEDSAFDWISEIINGMEETNEEGITGESFSELLPLNQKHRKTPLDPAYRNIGKIPHSIQIIKYTHHPEEECQHSEFHPASRSIRTVFASANDKEVPEIVKNEIRFLKNMEPPCTCKRGNPKNTTGKTCWTLDPDKNHPKKDASLLAKLPDWILPKVRRIEKAGETVHIDFYLDITTRPPWTSHFEMAFDQETKIRIILETGKDNYAYDPTWLTETLEQKKKLEWETCQGGNNYPVHENSPYDVIAEREIKEGTMKRSLPKGNKGWLRNYERITETLDIIRGKTLEGGKNGKIEISANSEPAVIAGLARSERICPLEISGDLPDPSEDEKELMLELEARGISSTYVENKKRTKTWEIITTAEEGHAISAYEKTTGAQLDPWRRDEKPNRMNKETHSRKQKENDIRRAGWWKEKTGFEQNDILVIELNDEVKPTSQIYEKRIQETFQNLVKEIKIRIKK